MIPADVDIDDLAQQLSKDHVALESSDSTLHKELVDAIGDLSSTEFGSVGIVVLDKTPDQTADLRDIAQVLLNESSVDSIIVRAPSSGAIVSNIHSRADIESAQWDFLANPDYPEATRIFGEQIMNNPSDATLIAVLFFVMAIVAIIISIVSALIFAKKQRGLPLTG